MKKSIAFALTLVLLLGLLPAAGAEGEFRFTRENFPTLDGSTSMVPLGQGIASVLLGESREDAADLICFNRTTQSFRNLREGISDLVIAAEPKSEVFQEMAQAHFPYDLEQIATEALVFVVNQDNPVNSLTPEQVRDIYAGEITNWSQVGGLDAPIAAFQRNASAGSQVMMEKLVMAGTPMMKAPSTMVPEEMGTLIEAVRSYDNSANAIGYTVFYYASDMQMAQGLKILQIDGITPSAQTLRSGEYPFLNGYYACISALAPKDSPQRLLYDWLVSEAGQQLLTLEGYVSVYAPGEATTDGGNIRTDYTSYTPNNGTPAKFTRFDCPKDHLEPRDDYGDIFPYEGAQLYGSWGYDLEDFQAGSLKGFFNHQGQLITDPIYTRIDYFPLDEQGGDYLWVVSTGDERYGYVARDGSFASQLCYDNIYRLGDLLLVSTDYQNHAFQLLDRNLNPVANQEDYTFDGKRYVPFEVQNGLTLCHHYHEDGEEEYILLDEGKNILLRTQDDTVYIAIDSNGLIQTYDRQWNFTLYAADLTPLELPETGARRGVQHLSGRFYQIFGDDARYIIDANGSLFEWGYESAQYASEDSFSVVKDGRMKLYDSNGRLKYSDLDPRWDYLGSGIFTETNGSELLLHKLPENITRAFTDGSFSYPLGECFQVSICTDDRWSIVLLDEDLNPLLQTGGDVFTAQDQITGAHYLLAYDTYGFSGEQRLLTPDAKTQLFQANGSLAVQGGCITVTNDWAFTCYDSDGNVIFCYPYFGMASGD